MSRLFLFSNRNLPFFGNPLNLRQFFYIESLRCEDSSFILNTTNSFFRKFALTRPSGASWCAFRKGRLVVAQNESASVTRFLFSGNGRRFESVQNARMKN